MIILGIDTSKLFTLPDAKKALNNAPKPKFGERDHNTYFYEMWPLVWVMEYMKADNTDSLRFSDGERTDDGLIIINGMKQEIQFTEAVDGHQEAIRMEHLDKFGRAPAVQDMIWEGNRRNRNLDEQNTVTFETGQILEKLKSLLLDAINRKLNDKYKGMCLGVVFEDYTPPFSSKRNQKYEEVFENVIQSHLIQLEKIYPKVFFIGKSGKFVKHYDLNFTGSGGQFPISLLLVVALSVSICVYLWFIL